MKTVSACDLTPYNSYRIPAQCETAYFPDTIEDVLTLATQTLRDRPYVLLGSGHNVILARTQYRTPFVIFNGHMDWIRVRNTQIETGAGAFTKNLCEVAAAHHLSGLEVFYDIPSSMGGAVVMNAGGHGEEMAERIARITYLDVPAAAIRECDAAGAEMTYRNSRFQNQSTCIVLAVELTLTPGDPAAIREKMERIKAERWAKQPREFPNAGSVFKRPDGRFVGPMIDELKLKGLQVAGFRVSPKPGGFIERTGPGPGRDLLTLIQTIQERVYNAYAIELEIEQRVIDVA